MQGPLSMLLYACPEDATKQLPSRLFISRQVPFASCSRCKDTKTKKVGSGFFGVAGGNLGRLGASQQHHQPPVEPPKSDNTDLKASAKLGVTSTLSRSSTVRTPDLRTSWTLQRNSTNTFATSSKESLLLYTSSFWVWAAPSTTPTIRSLSKNWVSILKELESLHPSSMCTLWTLLLVLTRRVLTSTIINSRQEPVSSRDAYIPPYPHWFFHLFLRWRSFTVLGTKVAPFP